MGARFQSKATPRAPWYCVWLSERWVCVPGVGVWLRACVRACVHVLLQDEADEVDVFIRTARREAAARRVASAARETRGGGTTATDASAGPATHGGESEGMAESIRPSSALPSVSDASSVEGVYVCCVV